MAHCPFDRLADLRTTLDEIRRWPSIREAAPGVFYVKRTPFLHFHVNREGRRWADARVGADWGAEIEIPEPASATVQRSFLREVHRRYLATGGQATPARDRSGSAMR
jgi:hypothetical protein